MPAVSPNLLKKCVSNSIPKKFKAATKTATDFLSLQHAKSEKIRILLQQTYDLTTSKDTTNKKTLDILPNLIVESLDVEQIWQLIELRNNVVWQQFVERTSKLLSLEENEIEIKYEQANCEPFSKEEASSDDKQSISNNSGESDNSTEDEYEDGYKAKYETKKKVVHEGKASIVDDQFFKLSDMEAFLKTEEEKDLGTQSKNDYNINYFDEIPDDEDEENIGYKDFFNEDEPTTLKQSKQKNKENLIDSFDQNGKSFIETEDEDQNSEKVSSSDTENIRSDSELNKEKPKSSFEDRQERLRNSIANYEQENLGEKPWQLKGEIQAKNRPQNSLLEEILEFEATSRPAPIITEETTFRLEDIIRQRIKNQLWDDVELNTKPINTPQEYRKQLVLDQEKSKESLAHIYEKQYQTEVQKLNPDAVNVSEKEPELHREIKEMMSALFTKLDALSNFHFTPKPVPPEPKILTNTPAVNLEEVAPVAISNSNLLAPEEIRKRNKGDTLGSNERSKTDKNRDKRRKKQKQKAIHKALEKKEGSKIDKKNKTSTLTKKLTNLRNVEKISNSKDAGSIKSSKQFFSKLNETTLLQKKSVVKKNQSVSLSAKNLKL